jgi:hypothetical protein
MLRLLRIIGYSTPYVFIFLASLYVPKDPDLGWHLKYGEYFFQHHQLLRENIFSTTMTGYQWANGSWITDIITYALYQTGGFFALTIASALIVTATFFSFAKAARFTILEKAIFFPLLIYLESPLNNHSFRGQQISMLLLGILFLLLSRHKPSSKILWWVPALLFLWVNLQAESFLGLAILGLWIGFMCIKNSFAEKKLFTKENLFLINIFLVSFFVTFLNPFGWGIHLDTWAHIVNPWMKKVNDYAPFPAFVRQWWNQIAILSLLSGGIVYLTIKRKLMAYLPWIGIPFILLLLSFDIRRYVWPAYYSLLPLLHILWQPIEPKIKKHSFLIAYYIMILGIAYACYLKMPFTQFTDMSWQVFCQRNDPQCTDASAKYLMQHNLTKNLFTFYDWGGWLIWNYPTIKPSTDGRMHVWRYNDGYSAFAEYDTYMNGEKHMDVSSYDVVYIPMERTVLLYTEMDYLVRQGRWKLVYDDGKVGIIVRVNR